MQSLFDKLWQTHEICQLSDIEYLLNIDRIFLHERTGTIALNDLIDSGLAIRDPSSIFCTMDHIVSTKLGRGDTTEMPGGERFITATREATRKTGITLFDLNDSEQGIVHVISPELGIAQPGITMVCPDSHTCTLGALGALAWGIGTTDAKHAMATQTLAVKKPKSMKVVFEGNPQSNVRAKDLILKLISQEGARGGTGFAVEFAGKPIEKLSIEGRMTVCNMAVEFSAFTGLIGLDNKTVEYVRGRRYAPSGNDWEQASQSWLKNLHSDPQANFDAIIHVDCDNLIPFVTWGTNPQQAIPISGVVPSKQDSSSAIEAEQIQRSLEYMNLKPGQRLNELKIDAAFVGSCTNSRLSDLRDIASFLRGKRVAPNVRAVCVPGSTQVKLAAEAEGLDSIITQAGFEWRESGCSMCFYAGGETFGRGTRVISSTNRNFEGRQGPGTRTHLASPITVAASAVAGHICGP